MAHYSLVHKFIPMPQAMGIPDAKEAVEKYEKLENPGMAADKSQNTTKMWSMKQGTRAEKFIFRH